MNALCWKLLLSLWLSLHLVPVATNAFRNLSTQGRFRSYRYYHHREVCTKELFLSPSENANQVGVETKNICVLVENDSEEAEEFREEAKNIAQRLGLPLLSTLERNNGSTGDDFDSGEVLVTTHALRLVPYEYNADEEPTFALAIEPIEIGDSSNQQQGKKKRKKKTKPKSPPFYVDLCPPANSKAGRRASGNSGKADLLVKAVAPGKGTQGEGAVVYDLTAGLGQDSLILARNGAKRVTMVERHPVVAALLEDALRRLRQIPSEENCGLSEKLRLLAGEAREVLQTENPSDCDVVYLDPMFPPRQKQSAVKKGMTILHGLLETHIPDQDQEVVRQEEEQELLEAALAIARRRVVVKRPAKAPLLGDGNTKPSHALTGSVNRWDVYVKPPSE